MPTKAVYVLLRHYLDTITKFTTMGCSVRTSLTALLLITTVGTAAFLCQLDVLPCHATYAPSHWLHMVFRLAGLAFTFSLGVLLQLLVS